MTATEKLRRLLDECGVEYEAPNDIITMWAGSVCSWIAIEDKDGLAVAVNRDYLNPEQTIAATVGRGTCRLRPWEMERDTGFYDCMECDCGYVADVGDWAEWNFCPNCRRRVVDE